MKTFFIIISIIGAQVGVYLFDPFALFCIFGVAIIGGLFFIFKSKDDSGFISKDNNIVFIEEINNKIVFTFDNGASKSFDKSDVIFPKK